MVFDYKVGLVNHCIVSPQFTTVENGFNITVNAYGLDPRATASLDAFQETVRYMLLK